MTASRADERREALLNAALGLIEDHGFDGLSMAALAARAGMSRPAVYQYFASREHVLGELLINSMADLSNDIDRLVATLDDPLEQARVWLHFSLAHVAGEEHRITREISVERLPGDMRGELMAMHGYFLSSLISPLAELGVKEPASHAHLIFAALGAAAKRIDEGSDFVTEAAVLERFVIAGIETARDASFTARTGAFGEIG